MKRAFALWGSIPIYVAFDSADTWANPELFQLDERNMPAAVAGCPPDGFSATGQLWGNPLYRWEYHKSTGYDWWMSRMWFCFAFDSRDSGSASDYLPHNYAENSAAYTGTHDNETIAGWFRSITDEERQMDDRD